jgi:hypothetical protein
MDNKDASLTTQCLDFCQALASQGQAFSFALTIGSTFSFSLDNREKVNLKKKPSPSTVIRNQKRREEFLKENSNNAKPVNLETSGQPAEDFKCEQCAQRVSTKKDLNLHTLKAHKIKKLPAASPKDGSSDPPPGVPVDEFGLPLPQHGAQEAEKPAAVKSLAKPVEIPPYKPKQTVKCTLPDRDKKLVHCIDCSYIKCKNKCACNYKCFIHS